MNSLQSGDRTFTQSINRWSYDQNHMVSILNSVFTIYIISFDDVVKKKIISFDDKWLQMIVDLERKIIFNK